MTRAVSGVDGLLRALDGVLPLDARVAWVPADGHATAGARLPAPVADLLPGLAQMLRRADGVAPDGRARLLLETADRTLLVWGLGEDGILAVDLRPDSNVALLRRGVEPALAAFVADRPAPTRHRRAVRAAGAVPDASPGTAGERPDDPDAPPADLPGTISLRYLVQVT
ncbi:hypothetical protein [Cellulomonas sp. NPDC058312]|uniref:hypothetical protein n=1 Tax=Cellulomonas sp. NPDC058312 TaxID=3346441 RepID=UPI0036E236D0